MAFGVFVKKPVVVKAVQFNGVNYGECSAFMLNPSPFRTDMEKGIIYINTLEGEIAAQKGDWIIRGVNGEFYPCKPDIFEKTYDSVN